MLSHQIILHPDIASLYTARFTPYERKMGFSPPQKLKNQVV